MNECPDMVLNSWKRRNWKLTFSLRSGTGRDEGERGRRGERGERGGFVYCIKNQGILIINLIIVNNRAALWDCEPVFVTWGVLNIITVVEL